MDTPRCDFWLQFHPQGSRFLFVQNNGAEPAFDTVVYIPADGSGFNSDVIHRLDSDRTWVPCLLKGNFFSMESARKVLVETLLHPPDGDEEVKVIPVLIRYRTHTQHGCEFHLEIRLPLQNGIQFALPVTEISTSEQDGADADRRFARLAIDEARKSVPENDGRPHPWVGAVVVKDGKVLGTAHRGEVPGNHAEFVALERNLPTVAVAGATVYTTLEPCTTRNPPKIPCVDRLIERRVARVVIGILDPDERIRGKGQRKLSNAGIETSLFPHDLAMEVEELNREFTRFCEKQSLTSQTQQDRTTKQPNPRLEQDERRKLADSVVLSVKGHNCQQRNYTIQIKNHSKELDVAIKCISLWSDGQRISEPAFRPNGLNEKHWDIGAGRELLIDFDAGETVAKRLWSIAGAPSMSTFHDTNLQLGHFRSKVRVEILYEVLGIEKKYDEIRAVQVDPINNALIGI
jgi:pyrimidine deaminase RibD-like protein